MDTFTLRVIFYGLVAFGLDDPRDTDDLQALLVDAPSIQNSSDGCAIPRHVAALYVQAGSCYDYVEKDSCKIMDLPESMSDPYVYTGAIPFNTRSLLEYISRPEVPSVGGGWPIRGTSIKLLTPSGQDLELVWGLRQKGDKLPASSREATDFSWVPISKTGDVLSNRCEAGYGECPIAARFHLDQGRVATCHLIESNRSQHGDCGPESKSGHEAECGEKEVCAYKLKPLGAVFGGIFKKSESTQAIADAVAVTMSFKKGTEIELEITYYDPKMVRKIKLRDGGEKIINVWVINVPPSAGSASESDDPCHNSKVDKHFELFYGLAREDGDPVEFSDRSIPRRTSRCGPASLLQPEGDSACPLLLFTRKDDSGNKTPIGNIPGDKPACATRQFVLP